MMLLRSTIPGRAPSFLSSSYRVLPLRYLSSHRTMSSDTFPPPALKQAAQDVATLLKDRKETISVAETAAGGLISAALLATPGASQIYRGGLTVSSVEAELLSQLGQSSSWWSTLAG